MARSTEASFQTAARRQGVAIAVSGVSGEAVFCVHSSGLSSRQWRPLAAALERSHLMVIPDILGYGNSTRPEELEGYETSTDVEALRAIVEALPGPVHYVGHSYGGLLALLIAAEISAVDPARVASVSAYEPVAFATLRANETLGLDDDPGWEDLGDFASRRFFDLSDGGYEAWLTRFVGWWAGPSGWASMKPPVQAAFRASQEKMHAEVLAISRLAVPLQAYGRISAPTLLMYGDRTRMAAKGVCRRLAAHLPNARAEAIDDAGHMGPLTHREVVNARFVDHIRRTNGPVA